MTGTPSPNRRGAKCPTRTSSKADKRYQAIAGEKQTNWRRILVRLCETVTCSRSLCGRVDARREDEHGEMFLDRNRLIVERY